ncbi:MAG: hypothetical protein ACR2HH_02365 [Chthoniobacterales bacterium]
MKPKSLLITAACIAALAFCVPVTGSAAAKKAASPAPAPATSPSASAAASPAKKAPRALPFHGNVASVDASAKTFTIAGKETSRTFKVSDKTVVTKAGAAATMADITANEAIRGSYWKQADGTLEAKTVKLGEMTDAEKAAAAKKSKKKAKAGKEDESASTSASPSATPKKK